MTHPPLPPLRLTVGVTGHRPPLLDAEVQARVAPRFAALLAQIAAATRALHAEERGFFANDAPDLRLLSPLAEGADRLSAEVALAAGYTLDVVLPGPAQRFRDDADPAMTGLIAQADAVMELPEEPLGDAVSFFLSGRATVAHCDLLIAIWDGERARGRGGTAEIVELALRRGRPVLHLPLEADADPILIWPGHANLVAPTLAEDAPRQPADPARLARLVRELLAPPADPRERECLALFLAEPQRRFRWRAEYPLLLAALGIRRFSLRDLAEPDYAAAAAEEFATFRATGGSVDLLANAWGWSDGLARHFGQTYRSGHILNFVLAATAVLLAVAGLIWPQAKFWFVLAEVAAVLGFVINTRVGTNHAWHRRWLDYRQLAERLRPMRSLKLLGVATPPLFGEGEAHRWFAWYAAAVWRSVGLPRGALAAPQTLSALVSAAELEPQLRYHRKTTGDMHRLDHRLHLFGLILFLLSIASCLGFLAAYLLAHDWTTSHVGLFVALSAGLPSVGSAVFGIRMQGDLVGASERSAATAQSLAALHETIDDPALRLSRLADIGEAVAAAMLADLARWQVAFQQRRLVLPG
ncbi:MAG: DUF4231 domain-containing protein [Sphingomonadales bacterium]|jgi:hypothetical protein